MEMTDRPKRETIRKRYRREVKVLILGAARALFAEYGFGGTTIRAIAERAGIGLGTVFNYFPDKSSLLVAALIDDLMRVHAEAQSSTPKVGSALEKFLHFSKCYFDYYSKSISLSRTLIKEMLFIEGRWGDALKEQYSQYILMLSEFIVQDESVAKGMSHEEAVLLSECLFSNYYSVLLMGLDADDFDVGASMKKLECMATVVLGRMG